MNSMGVCHGVDGTHQGELLQGILCHVNVN